MKFLKSGRVAIVLRGRYAGRKAVIVRVSETGNKSTPYAHALVVGIDRYPPKPTRRTLRKKQALRLKPFVKSMNLTHIMPTRYTVDLEGLKSIINPEAMQEVSQREDARKSAKRLLEERYQSGRNRWLFEPLRF